MQLISNGNLPNSPRTATLGVEVLTPKMYRQNFRLRGSQRDDSHSSYKDLGNFDLVSSIFLNNEGPHMGKPYMTIGLTKVSKSLKARAGLFRKSNDLILWNAFSALS